MMVQHLNHQLVRLIVMRLVEKKVEGLVFWMVYWIEYMMESLIESYLVLWTSRSLDFHLVPWMMRYLVETKSIHLGFRMALFWLVQ
jgi:hypothetical protein